MKSSSYDEKNKAKCPVYLQVDNAHGRCLVDRALEKRLRCDKYEKCKRYKMALKEVNLLGYTFK